MLLNCPMCGCKMKIKHHTGENGRPAGYCPVGKHKQQCFFEYGFESVFYAKKSDLREAWNNRAYKKEVTKFAIEMFDWENSKNHKNEIKMKMLMFPTVLATALL